MICVGREYGGPTVCRGDSGGPLACLENGKLVVAGIASYFSGYCESYIGQKSVFTRVSTYLTWIKERMGRDTSVSRATNPDLPDYDCGDVAHGTWD